MGEPVFRVALAALLLPTPSLFADDPSFAGKWMTSFGPCTLEQRGTTVEGEYGHGGDGRIAGRVTEGELELTWTNGGRSGPARWELLGDEAFKGTAGENRRFWGGYRLAPRTAETKPGTITTGQTEAGLRYHLRMPDGHREGRRWPAVCILHGSNMSSRAYVSTIAARWPDIARRFVLVGLDGEKLSSRSSERELAFIYTYVNFSGPDVGPVSARRQSPALVAESLEELSESLPVDKWLVGGHSQGGFLTYCLLMYYSDLVAGVFPTSGNLLVQCEPDRFDGERRERQHDVPVAVVHGRADNVVGFSGGRYGHARLVDGGFPAVRLFAPERVGHQFALLPIDEAIEWLDVLSSDDPERLVAFAEQRAEDGGWRDVGAALQRARADSPSPGLSARLRVVADRIREAAEPRAKSLAATMNRGGGDWVDEFLDFRETFGTSEAAEPVLAAYAKLREAQREEGNSLYAKSRRLRDEDERRAVYREIVERCYATRWYAVVKPRLK